jgi:leucyl-tRNA synthetase
VQVNGKLRDRLQTAPTTSREELEAMAREQPNVQAHVDGKEVVKVIVVPGKLVNFVVR